MNPLKTTPAAQVRAWLRDLDDSLLNGLRALIEAERITRRTAEAVAHPDPEIAASVSRIRALWAKQEADALAQYDAAVRRKLESYRAQLQEGSWEPPCTCDRCLISILQLTAPAGLCEDAQRGTIWWMA
jgi:hypothetical protein